MDVFRMFSNIILCFMLLSLFNLVRYMLKIRKVMKMHKDNPNVKGISIVNGEIKVIEDTPQQTEKEEARETIVDPVCGELIDKQQAYRIFKDNQEYYFCSWECREKFLSQSVQNES